MGMRVTTNMAMNLYRYNLQNSTGKMNDAMNKVMTHRKFDSFAEDPTAAVQAWRVRRAMVDNSSYQTNNNDTLSRFNVAFATMGMVTNKLVNEAAEDARIRGMNDPTAGARVQVGQVLQNTADSVIEAMNGAKYSDHFVFAGEDEMNAPLTWDGEKLYYRGVNVNAGGVEDPAKRTAPAWALDNAGNEIPAVAGNPPANMPADGEGAYEQAWIDYYNDPANAPKPTDPPAWGDKDEYGVPADTGKVTQDSSAYDRLWAEYYNDQGDVARLEKLSKEEQNVDMGMGLTHDANGLVVGTAFNRALPAINMLGYGVDENGDPNNVILVMKRLGEIWRECDSETGDYDKNNPGMNTEKAQALEAEATRLFDKLNACSDSCIGQYAEVTTKAHFLEENKDRMKLQGDYLNEDRYNLEQVDPADAISNYMYDYYCYNAALKVGTQLLSQSLIDYMN